MKYTPPPSADSLQPAKPGASKTSRVVSRRGKPRPISGNGDVSNGEPRLRLVGSGAPDAKPPTENPTPIHGATDPRWVLAVRTAEMLEADVLSPVKREKLMRTGKMMGLSAFDCSLIIAIVQDRARRGIAPDQCPAASESQLALIPLPGIRSLWSGFHVSAGQVALLAGGMLALQAMLMWIWLG